MKYFVIFKVAPLEEAVTHFTTLCEIGTQRLVLFDNYELATVAAEEYYVRDILGYKVHSV